MKEERAQNARLSRSDGAVRTLKRAEEFKKAQAKKQQQMDEAAKRSEMKLQQAKEEKERQHRLKSLKFKLRQEEMAKNQKHLERQQKMKNDAIKKNMEVEASRLQKLEQDKKQLTRERTSRIQKLQIQKQQIVEDIEQFNVKGKVDMNSISRLAKKYDIDIDSLKAKYETNQPSQLPPLKEKPASTEK